MIGEGMGRIVGYRNFSQLEETFYIVDIDICNVIIVDMNKGSISNRNC